MKHSLVGILLLAVLVAGCGAEDLVAPLDRAGGGSTAIVTDAQSYELREQGSGYAVDIGIRFQNQSTARMYIVNCHSQLAPVLEKRVGDAWVPYWSPVLLMCLSPPIVIEPGASLNRVLKVWGALPDTNQGPAWRSADIAGTYRIVLHSLVYNYTDSGQSFGEPVPLELRVSNEFTITR